MSVLVFAGPSLPASEIEAAGFVVLPPARQGDVYRAVKTRAPIAIGLIDGVFLDVPSVWHRELLWAMTQGVHVFGAASMGALRAVELAPFGMRGVGRVFEAYRDRHWPGFDGAFEDDDEVAVAHAPPEAGYASVSDAMVDLRDTLLALRDDGRIDDAQCAAFAAELKALPFPSRSLAALGALCDVADIERHHVPRKRLDARALLTALHDFVASAPSPHAPSFRLEPALVWQRFEASQAAAPSAEERLVIEELSIDPASWHAARRTAVVSDAALEEADTAAFRRGFDRFRRERGLWRGDDLEAWQAENGIDRQGLMRLIAADAARLSVAISDQAMLDAARLQGHYPALLARALEKQACLGEPRPDPLLDSVAQAWFAEAVGALAASPTAIRREYLYRQHLATKAAAS